MNANLSNSTPSDCSHNPSLLKSVKFYIYKFGGTTPEILLLVGGQIHLHGDKVHQQIFSAKVQKEKKRNKQDVTVPETCLPQTVLLAVEFSDRFLSVDQLYIDTSILQYLQTKNKIGVKETIYAANLNEEMGTE